MRHKGRCMALNHRRQTLHSWPTNLKNFRHLNTYVPRAPVGIDPLTLADASNRGTYAYR